MGCDADDGAILFMEALRVEGEGAASLMQEPGDLGRALEKGARVMPEGMEEDVVCRGQGLIDDKLYAI